MQTVEPESLESVHLGDLPVWRGVGAKPGYTTFPFTFQIKEGLVRLKLNHVELDAVSSSYASDSYNFPTTLPGVSEWSTRWGDQFFQWLKEGAPSLKGKTVLEIGAGNFYMAGRVIRELGARRYIICDPALKAEPPEASIEVVREYFSHTLFEKDKVDLVVSVNNLEHITEPHQYLTGAYRLLSATGGQLFLVLPESERGLNTGDWGICIHEHLNYFTQDSLSWALRRAGFQVRTIQPFPGDVMMGFAAASGKNARPEPPYRPSSIAQIRNAFQRNIKHFENLLNRLLAKRGARVGIHGCAAGLNNMLALVKANHHDAIHLFDGDSAKTGKYLPAFHKPIMDCGDPAYQTMTDMVVGASAFYDEIRKYAIQERGIAPNAVHSVLEQRE